MQIITELLAVLAALGLSGAVATAVAYWLFHIFAKGWLDSHFQRDLEALRAEHLREAERLKADLGRYADRAIKFHEREYEVLPEAWGKMNKAYGAVAYAISSFQESADLNIMSDKELEAWLEGAEMHDIQKSEIRAATNKNENYIKILTWKQIGEADKVLSEFNNYLILQGIFIDEDIATKMAEAGKIMRSALISRKMVERIKGNYSSGGTDFWIKATEQISPVGSMVEDIKTLVRHRLADIKLSSASE